MRTEFFSDEQLVYMLLVNGELSGEEIEIVEWLLSARQIGEKLLVGPFIGPRRELISPWSSNAVDIAHNVGLISVTRIECFIPGDSSADYDPMLQQVYEELTEGSLSIEASPAPVMIVEDVALFNAREGLALSSEEVAYLEERSRRLGRKFTDSEVFSFAQINSEHCRHKIFNGLFVLDGQTKPKSLFQLIKETSKNAPRFIVSAYRDNVAFLSGTALRHFAPRGFSARQDNNEGGCFKQGYRYGFKQMETVFSLKAETHNFPTTVEPFYGASTGSGGEIRDRMAGGMGSHPLAGTAVYMTAYPRLSHSSQLSCAESRQSKSNSAKWELAIEPRKWKYQSPQEILTKASNGASDFGNKFGQPLIAGSVLVGEAEGLIATAEGQRKVLFAFDRAVMLAGGIGFANLRDAEKSKASEGDKLVLLGGDNYRIGMGGGSVSSVATGKYSSAIELSAVQRANPEMQKRVFNVTRALIEEEENPIKLIHDHGAGGHVNCFSELFEETGGSVELANLPIGDPTLSAREIIANESQERMGLIISPDDIDQVEQVALRERAPCYVVGSVGNDKRLQFIAAEGSKPFDLPLDVLLGSSPKTILQDAECQLTFTRLEGGYSIENGSQLLDYFKQVLSLESVACKDWLTNKVDRCVTGRVALQQCTGPRHLPLNDAGVMALDYLGQSGVATSIGHAPMVALLDEKAGSVLSVCEALTNLLGCPLSHGLEGIALSANWMWPGGNSGEWTRLYNAVEALSQFALSLGIPVPTGKDSLSMTMNYSDGTKVLAPGTVVVSAGTLVDDVRKCVSAELKSVQNSVLLYVDLSQSNDFPLGGSSFAQVVGRLGGSVPQINDVQRFSQAFRKVHELVMGGGVLAIHDVASGGLLTSLVEMAIVGDVGVTVDGKAFGRQVVAALFSEKPGVVLQVRFADYAAIIEDLSRSGIDCLLLGKIVCEKNDFELIAGPHSFSASLSELLAAWLAKSIQLESKQVPHEFAVKRMKGLTEHKIDYLIPERFTGKSEDCQVNLQRETATGLRAVIVREQGTNGEREMAISLHAAGFDVEEVTMSDLSAGRASLRESSFAIFPGGFANGDVLGAARGWAGVFRFNKNAKRELADFLFRDDTLSLGVCNGCQLLVQLGVIELPRKQTVVMKHNLSGKFECGFVPVDVLPTSSIMLSPLEGSRLGIWVAHGEGRFELSDKESAYDLPLRYAIADYPFNPNGSRGQVAAISSADGRHLAMMPHLERSILPWQWPYRGPNSEVASWEITPWMLAFTAARQWIQSKGSDTV